MKFMVFLSFAMVTLVAAIYTAQAAKVCVIRLSECTSTNTTCARVGRSNLCQRFSNNCTLALANCRSSVTYNRVANALCTGLSTNARGLCRSTTSSTSSSSLSSVLSALGASGSNVRPIIINRG